jgi:hypothetical protein
MLKCPQEVEDMASTAARQYRVTNLWKVLEQRERSAEWLAKKVGYTGQYFRLIRAGKRPVSEEVARRVSAFLELPVEALFAPLDSLIREETAPFGEAAD